MDIKDKVAIVTGGASGLGEGTVRAYVAKGGKVAIFDMNAERGAVIVEELGADNVSFHNVNVADEDSVATAIAEVVAKFGAIHICNNYAGIGNAAKTLSKNGPFPLDAYKNVINVNLVGTFNVARLVAEQMAKNAPYDGANARGVIINTASVAAYEGQVGQVAYSASKGGVVGMTLPMARDLASYGIRVNTIVPGLIHTPLFESIPEAAYKSLENSVVNPQRLGRPDEIAHLSVMIAENEYMNGESIRLDGAIRMQPR
ncbi:putative oxidoreductase [Zhongshania aliphaticivorans]|uniref:Putative oxidoreductase n=1 Tax=Zhongshania aliphaticivorans TaxID=1470434 RepID=A0A5S9NII9_9GAMM|nr:SDR family NAD(P)-dependent oxidoreductase [Zhongshania aliphaticivorans]CAA0090096.1 putative oxidoreductase [Zhongshania aliphaticivorans]CAA0097398.1 putative oxidoreductase [Zhongshania aliphaticivorans]